MRAKVRIGRADPAAERVPRPRWECNAGIPKAQTRREIALWYPATRSPLPRVTDQARRSLGNAVTLSNPMWRRFARTSGLPIR